MSKFWKGFLLGFSACFFCVMALIAYGIIVSTDGGLREPNLVVFDDRKTIFEVKFKNVKTLEETTIPNNEVVFLNVWQTWCGPCLNEMKSIESLHKKFSNIKFYIISDEDINKVKKVTEEKNLDLPFFINTDKLPNEIRGESVPRTYIIHNGKVILSETGARKWDTPKVVEFLNKLSQKGI